MPIPARSDNCFPPPGTLRSRPGHNSTVANTLADLLLRWSGLEPSRPCLRTPTGEVWTYADLSAQSARMAHALTSFGVGRGDRVAVQVAKRPEVLSLNIACARIGAIYVPLNGAYTAHELQGLLDDAQPAVLIVDCARDVTHRQLDFQQIIDQSALQPSIHTDAACTHADAAAMLFTSGTTGRPKGAVISHGNLAHGSLTLSDFWQMNETDVVLHTLPLFHVHGLYVAAYNTLMRGGCMILLESFEVDAIIETIPDATVLMGVPTHYVRLLADPRFTRELTSHMRLFTSGSAPMLVSTHEEFRDRTGATIVERYGMTETHILTSNPIGAERIGTVGIPLPGLSLRLAPVTDEIEVKGPTVFGGYWRRPELTDEFTADGYFRTGDIGRIDADGYVEIIGRAKDLIISGGLNVYPKEVEEVLNSLPGVLESAVIGVPDADFGEAVTAIVVGDPGTDVDGHALRLAARDLLAGFKVPKEIHVVAALPRNAMGKVEKSALRHLYSST